VVARTGLRRGRRAGAYLSRCVAKVCTGPDSVFACASMRFRCGVGDMGASVGQTDATA